MNIVVALKHDARQIANIKHCSFKEEYKKIFPISKIDEFMNVDNLASKIEQEILQFKKYFILKEKGTIVGYAKITIQKAFVELEELYVLPQMQGKGYGKKLFGFVVDYSKANNFNKLKWNCYAASEKVVNFYLKNNAKIVEESEGEAFNIKAAGYTMELTI